MKQITISDATYAKLVRVGELTHQEESNAAKPTPLGESHN